MATDRNTDLLTVEEAARLLKVSTVTVHRWLRQGLLPAYRAGPRVVRIRRNDLGCVMAPMNRESMAPGSRSVTQPFLTTPQPMTDEEAEEQRLAFEAARLLVAQLRAQRTGLPAESWPLIRAAREERAERL